MKGELRKRKCIFLGVAKRKGFIYVWGKAKRKEFIYEYFGGKSRKEFYFERS